MSAANVRPGSRCQFRELAGADATLLRIVEIDRPGRRALVEGEPGSGRKWVPLARLVPMAEPAMSESGFRTVAIASWPKMVWTPFEY